MLKFIFLFIALLFKIATANEPEEMQKFKVKRGKEEKDVILFANTQIQNQELNLTITELFETVQNLMKRKHNIFPVLAKEVEGLETPFIIEDFANFRARSIDYIITSSLTEENKNSLKLKILVWDVYENKNILEEEFLFTKEELNQFAYKFATRVYEFITGEYPFFYGKLLQTVAQREGVMPFKRVVLTQVKEGSISGVLFTDGKQITLNPNYCDYRKEILFSSQTKKEGMKLFILNRETGKTEMLPIALFTEENARSVSLFSPTFSSNCEQILFSSLKQGSTNLYLYSRTAKSTKQLTNSTNNINTSAVFSANNKKIYFVSDRNKKPKIWLMNADGTSQKQLTTEEGADYAPSVSFSGKYLAFVNVSGGKFTLKVMDLKTEVIKNLYSAFLIEDPSFAPSGQTIIFSMKKNFKDKSRIYKLSLNENEPEELESLSGNLNEPKWIEEF